jgi:hypothetical protein
VLAITAKLARHNFDILIMFPLPFLEPVAHPALPEKEPPSSPVGSRPKHPSVSQFKPPRLRMSDSNCTRGNQKGLSFNRSHIRNRGKFRDQYASRSRKGARATFSRVQRYEMRNRHGTSRRSSGLVNGGSDMPEPKPCAGTSLMLIALRQTMVDSGPRNVKQDIDAFLSFALAETDRNLARTEAVKAAGTK